jgi:2-C-methyl-D-erythritol 4-phosphate cytidylyltransferase
LERVSSDADFVAIHDAARPCIADVWIDKVFAAAEKSGAAMLATPVVGTLKRSADGRTIDETVPREHLWEAQTPQVFRREMLEKAYAQRAGFVATDDAQLVERLGESVQLVEGSRLNLKITRKEDLKIASAALKSMPRQKRSGGSGASPLDDMWR